MYVKSKCTFTCLEVEYTLNADKAVIPIRIHRSYVLDGWLSAALANHSVLNFADAEDFDAGMSQLLQRVSAVTGLVAATSDAGNLFVFTRNVIFVTCSSKCSFLTTRAVERLIFLIALIARLIILIAR